MIQGEAVYSGAQDDALSAHFALLNFPEHYAMNEQLLKKTGNMDQLCGIRESVLLRGRGEGMKVLQCTNAAGLSFTVVPDRCMDLYDFSFRGINFAFHSRNGLVSPLAFSPNRDEFAEQWTGGFLTTCGLDNVNLHSSAGEETLPTHGRIGAVQAREVQTDIAAEKDQHLLRITGRVQQTCMGRRSLMLTRTIETGLCEKQIRITDRITNLNASPEPVMLLYHINFGYPLLQETARAETFGLAMTPLNEHSQDPVRMTGPRSGRDYRAEAFLGTAKDKEIRTAGQAEENGTEEPYGAGGFVYCPESGLGCLVRFSTENLPCMVEWKHMKACDYVLSLEPTNTFALNREGLEKSGKLTCLEGFACMETRLCIQVAEGKEEIEAIRRKFC